MGRCAYFFRLSKKGVSIARRHALQDGQVKLDRLLDGVEHTPQNIRLRVARDRLHIAARQHVEVQLRPDPLEGPGEFEARSSGGLRVGRMLQQFADHGGVVAGMQGDVLAHHHGREARVDHGRADRVLDRTDEHRLIDELVFAPAQAPDLAPQRLPARLLLARDVQHFEIGPPPFAGRDDAGHDVGEDGVFLGLPLVGEIRATAQHEDFGDMAREAGRFVGISGFDQSAQALDRRASGDGVKLLQDGEFVDGPDQSVRALAPCAPFPRLVGHGLPAVVARGVKDKELVDAGRRRGHECLPLAGEAACRKGCRTQAGRIFGPGMSGKYLTVTAGQTPGRIAPSNAPGRLLQ